MEKIYRADYDRKGTNVQEDSWYFWAEDDKQALNLAKAHGLLGIDYGDIGHVELELVQLYEVEDNEFCSEKRLVWF